MKSIVALSGTLISIALGVGMAKAGSVGGVTTVLLGRTIPVFSLCSAVAFGIQWVAFVPAYLLQTEKFYDLTGSITYLTVTSLGLLLSTKGGSLASISPVSGLIGGMVVVWALRLGTFLFTRVLSVGEDSRFRKLKTNPLQFFMTWTLQGLWVTLTFSAGLAAITSVKQPSKVGPLTLVGAAIWLAGFLIEAIADEQKRRFRNRPESKGKFIKEGLWAHSRHPNYFGEILLWSGVAVAAFPVLSGWQYVTMISPVFVYTLLTSVSGVNLLEAAAKKRWGDDPEYKAYCRRTPSLMLNPFH